MIVDSKNLAIGHFADRLRFAHGCGLDENWFDQSRLLRLPNLQFMQPFADSLLSVFLCRAFRLVQAAIVFDRGRGPKPGKIDAQRPPGKAASSFPPLSFENC